MPFNYPPLPYFAGFTAFTPEVPKLYWDVKSQEQRIFELCKEFHKVVCYANELAKRINALSDDVEDTLEDFENRLTEQLEEQNKKIDEQLAAQNEKVDKALADMREYIDLKFEEYAEGMLLYDITTGEYRPSYQAMRRLFQALSFDHKGDEQIVEFIGSNYTVAQLAQQTVYHTAYSSRRDVIIDDQRQAETLFEGMN